MRKLKKQLADGEVYTFSTLTLKEQSIARRMESMPDGAVQDAEEITKKINDGKATKEERERLEKMQDAQIADMLKIVQMSLAKNHRDKFEVSDKRTQEQIIDGIQNLIDLRDMRQLVSFAMLGSIPHEKPEEFEADGLVDLTAGM